MRKEPIEEIKLADLKGIKNKNIISLATFGSFNTKYWRNGFSDIDILVLIEHRNDVMEEFDIEDEIIPILEKHFEYNKIHLTFLEMKEFDTVFARQYTVIVYLLTLIFPLPSKISTAIPQYFPLS